MKKTSHHFIYFLYCSIAVHLGIIASLCLVMHDETLHKPFIVLGAHSQRPTKALYKPLHNHVPFVRPKTEHKATITKQKKETKKTTTKKAPEVTQKTETATAKLPELPAKKNNKKKKGSLKKNSVNKKDKKTKIDAQKNKKSSQVKKPLEEKKENPIKKKSPVKPPQQEQPKSEQKQQPLDEETVSKEIIPDSPAETTTDEVLTFSSAEEQYNPELYHYHVAIQDEVARSWHPPVGVEKGTEAVCFFALGADGSIETFEFISKSNIIIYDLSIKRAAQKFSFDKKLWGKKFTIAFRQ